MVQLLAPLLAEAAGVSVALATASLTGWALVFHIKRIRAAIK